MQMQSIRSLYHDSTFIFCFVQMRSMSTCEGAAHTWPKEEEDDGDNGGRQSETTSYTVYARKPVVVGRRHGTCMQVSTARILCRAMRCTDRVDGPLYRGR